jgi:CobQ-like glutamine amidotransferase family enzyme
MELRIAWLYGDIMNIYGDFGNLLALSSRCRWRGIEVSWEIVSIDDDLEPDRYDLYLWGGGQDAQQELASKDLMTRKLHPLREAAASGAVFLAICGGYQLLGHYYRPHRGPELPGAGLLDIHTVAGPRRQIGNVVVQSPWGELVGFENHSGLTYLGPQALPLGYVLRGGGNNGADGTEGAVAGSIFGTYLHGPVLPKNPCFSDHLIRLALRRRYGAVELAPLDDALEMAAHISARKRASSF